MKLKTLSISFLLVVFSCSIINAQPQNYPINGRTLTWSDFKGTPDKDSRYWAYTYWNVYYRYDAPQIIDNKVNINFKVWCELDSKSWVKSNPVIELKKAQLLNHEQGHFNIAQILVKELEKNFKAHNYDINTYESEIKEIFNTTFAKYRELEKRYDNETNHMNNVTEQEKWNKFFQESLK